MRMKAISLCAFLCCNLSLAAVQKFCVAALPVPAPLEFILSVNSDSQMAATAMNLTMLSRKIEVKETNESAGVQFVAHPMNEGDCLLMNQAETVTLEVARGSKRVSEALVPSVYFRKVDGAKLFGLVPRSALQKMREEKKHHETATSDVLRFEGKHKDLTLLYVICPKARDEVCLLTFKQNGRWVKQPKTGRNVEFPVFARAKRESDASTRLFPNGDTPQGIYYIWATMFNDDIAFGGVPRIDLDSAMPPINAHPYNLNSYLLSEIVPKGALGQYWLNEWPLAYRLGRIHLRLHGTKVSPSSPNAYVTPKTKLCFRPTEGCINTGDRTAEILAVLVKLGVFEKGDTLPRKQADASKLGWRVSPLLGKAFLIVKDED